MIRSVLRLGVFAAAVLLCSFTLGQLWPRSQRTPAAVNEGEDYGLAHDAAVRQPLTLLLLGLEPVADQQQHPPRANGILLVRLQPDQPVRILQIPAQTAVSVPGSGMISVGEAYSVGGMRLVADLLAELLGRQEAVPSRYILARDTSLPSVVDAMGGIPMTLERSPALHPLAVATRPTTLESANADLALAAGPQRLDGQQVAQYLRHEDPLAPAAWRLERQRRLIGAMVRVLDAEEMRRRWSELAQAWLATSRTNLSDEELLSLLALLNEQPLMPVVQSLPLQPVAPEATVRAWLDDQMLPPETVLVEGPAPLATAFRRQLLEYGTPVSVRITPADGVQLRRTRLLAWRGEEPPAFIQTLVGNNALRNDAPAANVAITVRLGTDWPR